MPSELGAAFDTDGYYLAVTTPADLSDLLNTTGATSPLTLALGTPFSAEIIDDDGIYPVPLAELTTASVTMRWYQGVGGGIPLTGPELSQSFCELAAAGKPPYLKITGGIELRTLYGDPASQAYSDATIGLFTPPVCNFRIIINGGTCGAVAEYNFFPVQLTGSDNFPTT